MNIHKLNEIILKNIYFVHINEENAEDPYL